MIYVNRRIFLAIDSLEIKREYIEDCIYSGYPEHNLVEAGFIAENIINVILRNEHIISTYGWEAYINEDYPAEDCCSGYSYTSGKIVIVPFDWSADDISELNYNFVLAEVL